MQWGEEKDRALLVMRVPTSERPTAEETKGGERERGGGGAERSLSGSQLQCSGMAFVLVIYSHVEDMHIAHTRARASCLEWAEEVW